MFDLPGVDSERSEHKSCIDCNNRVAGKQSIVQARIISVSPADVDKVEMKF